MSTSITFKQTPLGNLISLDLEVRVRNKSNWWFAYCEPLKISGFSKISKEKAAEDLFLNAKEFISYHGKKDKIIQVLENFGWCFSSGKMSVSKNNSRLLI